MVERVKLNEIPIHVCFFSLQVWGLICVGLVLAVHALMCMETIPSYRKPLDNHVTNRTSFLRMLNGTGLPKSPKWVMFRSTMVVEEISLADTIITSIFTLEILIR